MPRTSVKIWQRSAPSAAARATAVVSLPPRPSVVISWSASAWALWPWKPATITTLPPASSARTRRGSIPAIRARPYVPSVVMPAWGPVRLMAWTPIACRAIDTSVALWCSPVASSMSSSRGSGSSVIPAASPSSSSVVSPIADTTATRALPRDRSRAIRRATRLIRSAPATEEPPNFWTTSGAGIARHSTVARFDARTTIQEVRAMCFDHDSRPPVAEIAGGALDGRHAHLAAADGARLRAFRARPTEPSGAGVVILPDVRGLHRYYEELALRFAERGIAAVAIDWFGRTAPDDDRSDGFGYLPHVTATTWSAIAADITAGVEALRAEPDARAVFTLGFCMGGRMSFLAGTLGLDLAGLIGFYGTLAGPWRNDAPEPVAEAGRIAAPVLGLFGGADGAITAEAIGAFDNALTAAGTEHRLVTYPGAPHSFFDRKAQEFAEASAQAWDETLAFVAAHTG